jgi:predicted permease
MTAWLRDLRYASRALRANPGFTSAALVTMTAAIAATTAVFSVVDAALLRPLPLVGADRAVAVGTTTQDAPGTLRTASIEEVEDWQRLSKTMGAFGAWRDWGMLRYDGARKESVFGMVATPGIFDVFPVRPVLGRLLSPDDDRPGAHGVVVLAYGYWRQRFAGDPAVLGATLDLERDTRATYTIVGVLPAEFNEMPSFERTQMVLPSSADPGVRTGRGHRNRRVFARLRDGVPLAAARAEMRALAAALAGQYPATNADRGIGVMTAIDAEVGAIGDTLRAFFAAVGLVLLIAAANVAGLQLARSIARRREFSIRRALGGSRAALVRALVSETAILSLVAGSAALVAARWLVEAVLTQGPAVPRVAVVPFDLRVFGFTMLVCAVSSLALALPAAWLSTRVEIARALREQSAQVAGSGALRARLLFVGAQAALALMLLVGAASATRTLARQLSLRPGFEPEGLASIQMFPPMARYPKGPDVSALYERIIDAARDVPGITAASAVSAPPLSGEGAEPAEFTVEGQTLAGPTRPSANTFNVAPGYFRVLGAMLQRGRDVAASDTGAAPAVAIVNGAFVRRYLGAADPLATTLRLGQDGDPVRIVGVAADVLQEATPHVAAVPEIYLPYSQRPRWATFLVVRTAGLMPATALAAVRERINAVDPDTRAGAPVSIADRLQRSARGPKLVTLLFGLFAGMALLLSVTGIAGLVLYTTAQRSREIAVRVSLGASAGDVIRVVGAGAFAALVAGSIAGIAGSMVLTRALVASLRDLDPVGPGLAVGTAVVFVALGALACYFPARRAALTDPASVMKG